MPMPQTCPPKPAGPAKKRIVLLGATGSIGENALRVIAAHRDRLELVGIAARANHRRLAEIARQFGVRNVGIFENGAFAEARTDPSAFPAGTRLHGGLSGLIELAQLPEADMVLVAVVGTAGLRPALAALAAHKNLALASKELLVMAGKFVMEAARANGVQLLPVDSEHNAVFQCLDGQTASHVQRIVLTASGGAFRELPLAALGRVTPEDALKHPNWSMGPKITVDSATLANKGLELIEAQWLFGLRPDQCQAVLHPQSIVHCLVQFADGTMLAQLAPPSMTFPIQHALLYPERVQGVADPLDLNRLFSLDFRPVDEKRYPCLSLARATMMAGGVAPAVFNAANEVAVTAFLAGRVPFLAIPELIDNTLQATSNFEPADLDAVLEADIAARQVTQSRIANIKF